MYDTKIPLDKPIAEAFKKRTEKTATNHLKSLILK